MKVSLFCAIATTLLMGSAPLQAADKSANSFLMIPNATDLSDDDIANLAAFITESGE